MKKIFLSLLAVAALASCTKSEVLYEAPQEIGFRAVAGNMTKAAVDGTVYPTTLNMYVFAETTDNTGDEPNYIKCGEFTHKGLYKTYVTGATGSANPDVWGGTPSPYYWPNVKRLHFAGYSQSGNANASGVYSCNNGTLTINNYSPGNASEAGANDLMWFPTTELTKEAGYYGKETPYVQVDMYHTCSWITFLVKGDNVTGASVKPYTVKSLTITNIDQTANVTCSATETDGTVTPNIVWSGISAETQTETYSVPFKTPTGVVLTQNAVNVETDDATTTSGNVVIIPQTPGKLTLVYSYESQAGTTITETVTGIDLKLAEDATDTNDPIATGPAQWEPGKHYIYTITIKANEILIAPKPVDWTDGNWNITIE